MAYLSLKDANFWKNGPGQLHTVQGNYETDGAQGARFLMGKRAENPPTVIALRMSPGYVLARHSHECYRFEVIAQGSLDTGEGQILEVGDLMITEPGVAYGPHIAGPEGCITYEIFTNTEASYKLSAAGADGAMVVFDISTDAGRNAFVQATARPAEIKEPV